MYPADGRKLPDIYTQPADFRFWLQRELGQFPLFQFWGPATSIRATQWIADAARLVDQRYHPTLTLIYLPHLDYCLQRIGPDPEKVAADLAQLDAVCGQLIDHYRPQGARILILSEYGIVPVSRPVHLNRVLRQAGLLAVRQELGRELLDAGASPAFAVADHQVAHVYVNDPMRLPLVRKLLESAPGVARVLDEAGKKELRLDHPRSGELIALAQPDAWFTYYYWLDDRRMPDFARTVDIHRKPGYDPAELFIDPDIKLPKLRILATLLKRKLGFRTLLEVVPPRGEQVRGSHGLPATSPLDSPLLITQQKHLVGASPIEATDVSDVILRHLCRPDVRAPTSA
jgi:predicted AlkP superfamily pyrophosphatase or phosphodiesterase